MLLGCDTGGKEKCTRLHLHFATMWEVMQAEETSDQVGVLKGRGFSRAVNAA
jgi:hypothetical protein